MSEEKEHWAFSVRLRGENGEVEMKQSVAGKLSVGHIREEMIQKAVDAYKKLEPV